MKLILTFYYWLTAWIPRLLPRDANEWQRLQEILVDYYGLPDTAPVWATIAGHVCSTPSYRIRRSYAYLANVARRLQVNAEGQKISQHAKAQLMKLLEQKMQENAQKENIKAAVAEAVHEASESNLH